MIWVIIIAVLLAVITWYVLTRRQRGKEAPDAIYVCDVCGERDCECHKVNADSQV